MTNYIQQNAQVPNSIKVAAAFVKAKKLLESKGTVLKDYQVKGVKWMLDKEINSDYRGGLLCDDPGLGKTIQTIGLMAGNPVSKTLIIVPTSLVDQWEKEINKYFPDKQIYKHYGNRKAINLLELFANPYDICISTYGNIFTKEKSGDKHTVLHKVKWDRIILDEAHIIKDKSTTTHIMCKDIQAKHHWGLSGTPVQNDVADIKNLFSFVGIHKELLDECLEEVIDNYVLRRNKTVLTNGIVPKLQEENDIEPGAVTDEDFVGDIAVLKDYIIQQHFVPFDTEEEQLLYSRIYNHALHEYYEAVDAAVAEGNGRQIQLVVLELLIRLRQLSVHPTIALENINKKHELDIKFEKISTKINKVISLVKEANGQCLVFCQFRKEMEYIKRYLAEQQIDSDIYDGSLSLVQRKALLEKHTPKSSIVRVDGKVKIVKKTVPKVLIVQIKAGGVGLNLQQFRNVIICSPDWNPCNEIQAIARAHRLGQKEEVKVHKVCLVANKEFVKNKRDIISTIDERIHTIQKEKRTLMSNLLKDQTLLGNEKAIGTRLNADDFKHLLLGN
jgi:SNF2 family DNA or RNA helicase